MELLKKILKESGFPLTAIAALGKLDTRDGFEFPQVDDLKEMMAFFREHPALAELVPILTDNNSNYICVYKSGPLLGKICYFSYGETSLDPKFRNIENLVTAISANPDAWDFTELPEDILDYPLKLTREDNNIKESLFTRYHEEADDDIKTQLAFSIMSLTPTDNLEELYPFLNSDDMYIQERAIDMLGFHRYMPAADKLAELQTTALPNGQSAAVRALKRINAGK
jgi:hypothetical protein